MPGTVGEHQIGTIVSPPTGGALDSGAMRGVLNSLGGYHNDHDEDPSIHVQFSTLAARPAAATAGQAFWVTEDPDEKLQLWYSDGVAWFEITGLTFAVDNGQPALYDAGNSGTTKAIDWKNGPVQKVTLTGNCTFTFSNAAAGGTYTLILVQGVGGHTVTLTGWDFGANPPSYTTTSGAKNVVSGLYDGTEYLAAFAVKGAS